MYSPDDKHSKHTIIRPTRLIKPSRQLFTTDKSRRYRTTEEEDVEAAPTTALPTLPPTLRPHLWEDGFQDDPDADTPVDLFDVRSMSTMRLIEISCMMHTMRPSVQR